MKPAGDPGLRGLHHRHHPANGQERSRGRRIDAPTNIQEHAGPARRGKHGTSGQSPAHPLKWKENWPSLPQLSQPVSANCVKSQGARSTGGSVRAAACGFTQVRQNRCALPLTCVSVFTSLQRTHACSLRVDDGVSAGGGREWEAMRAGKPERRLVFYSLGRKRRGSLLLLPRVPLRPHGRPA